MAIHKEDYEEPNCPFCTPDTFTPVPVGRILEKLDEYLNKKDFSGAEKHLLYWLGEAMETGDRRGALTILNEQIGLYRKTEQYEKGLSASEKALAFLRDLSLEKETVGGTTFLNVATFYKACDRLDFALDFYKKAQAVYESTLSSTDERLAGLYNNMSLALMDTGDTDTAEKLFQKALSVLEKNKDTELDQAITYLNLADLQERKSGAEAGENKINDYLEKAMSLFNTPTLKRDGYYAFVSEKCAPVFAYYGFFLYETELKNRAKEYYERT